uniref:RRM domain-containing protein n=1 Tax=Ganoderma boninense TaxID=34458 RepID=A0A5K1JTY0_9APHY|nr:Eukaryotic translation initiation factor 3 subunit G (eIF3g) (Eukaryotic translation initiation factor 3 RNA-binding subunit) (eIF-3 RNA-binding subunit) (Translation initiation factor eIF3 p33 subunit homolog) (eIF3 p33 homolog) [Ganoderma boninense]
MSTLGKRKEREKREDEQPEHVQEKHHGSTLFVSNLPYTATSTDIKTLFSDIAPVRSAFVVLEHGTGVSKGVGYVSFAIREDATMAIDKISKEGITLDGRSLRVQWAGSKNKDHEQDDQPKPKADKSVPRPTRPTGPADPLAIRTVVVSGLPGGIDSKTLWKKVRKLPGAEKVEWPIKLDGGQEDSTLAHAIFETPANAMEAVNKLHAHVYKGSLLSATLKKRLDGLAKAAKSKPTKPSSSVPQKVKSAPAPNRNSRLIVRNLPFDVTEQDLRAIFLPYGPIYSVHIPLTSDAKHEHDEDAVKLEGDEAKPRTQVQAQQRSKGFAFVWFLSRKDAEKAMEGCNGMTVEAGMAETLVSDKQKKKKQRREEKKLKEKSVVEGEAAVGEEGEEEDDGSHRKRTIAVDWALSKDKWEAEKAKLEEAQEQEKDEDVEMDGKDSESSSSEDGEDGSQESDEEEQLGVHDDDSDSNGSDAEESDSNAGEDDENDEDGKPAKPTLPAPEVGTTVFVRNVPFEATEDELRTLFRAFGPLRYARITMDHATGRSRGTGFACFWNKEDADKAIEQSDILRAETLGNEPVTKKNPFKLPSLLTPDPSASIARNLVLHGRTLDVSRAVTRDEASKLKEAGERQREKADKRNLYLLREGIILPNSPAADQLPPAEVEKRTQSFNARRALLRSNPSLFVSRTRLSVRQIPLFVSERMLKRLAIHSIRAFEKEAKEGKREPLTADELAEPAAAEGDAHEDEDVKMEDDDDDSPQKGKKGKRKGGTKDKGRNTGVKQAKIVRQQDRVDAVTGKGRSRGYGFLELGTHADALRVLRWANNSAAVGRLFEEWWRVELEDLVAAEKRKPEGTRDDARIKRIREEIEKGVPPKSRGTLIVEFSIENIQVVQRRAAKTGAEGKGREGEKRGAKGGKEQKTAAAPGGDRKAQRRKSLPNVKTEEAEEEAGDRPKKKRRVSDPPKPTAKPSKGNQEHASSPKAGKHVGSLIGRKRKERKTKKARQK